MARIVRLDALLVDLEAEGAARRRDPVLRQPGDADRPDHRRRRGGRHRLRLHHRHRRPSVMELLERTLVPALIGREAGEIEAIWRDLLFLHPCHHGRRHHRARAGGNRHRAVGSEVPQARPAAAPPGRRRAGAGAALHHRRRLAASRAAGAGGGCARRQGAGLGGCQDQDRPAACRRGHARASRRCARRSAPDSRS